MISENVMLNALLPFAFAFAMPFKIMSALQTGLSRECKDAGRSDGVWILVTMMIQCTLLHTILTLLTKKIAWLSCCKSFSRAAEPSLGESKFPTILASFHVWPQLRTPPSFVSARAWSCLSATARICTLEVRAAVCNLAIDTCLACRG